MEKTDKTDFEQNARGFRVWGSHISTSGLPKAPPGALDQMDYVKKLSHQTREEINNRSSDLPTYQCIYVYIYTCILHSIMNYILSLPFIYIFWFIPRACPPYFPCRPERYGVAFRRPKNHHLRIFQHTPGTYPRPPTNGSRRKSPHSGVQGFLGYAPRVCCGFLRHQASGKELLNFLSEHFQPGSQGIPRGFSDRADLQPVWWFGGLGWVPILLKIRAIFLTKNSPLKLFWSVVFWKFF